MKKMTLGWDKFSYPTVFLYRCSTRPAGRVMNLHDFRHFLDVNDAVAVDVIHAECPLQLLFGCAA